MAKLAAIRDLPTPPLPLAIAIICIFRSYSEHSKPSRGRDFYAQKDKAMAKKADIGFVLWDGKSTGSVANALELLKADKKVVLYYAPEKEFYNLSSMDDIESLLRKCRPDVLSTISRRVDLAGFPREMQPDGQTASALSG